MKNDYSNIIIMTIKKPFNYYSCMGCNYSKSSRTETESKLAGRLHQKVCKGTGRTEDLPHTNHLKQHIKKNKNNKVDEKYAALTTKEDKTISL